GAVEASRRQPEPGGTSSYVPWGRRGYDSRQVKLEARARSVTMLASYTYANGLTWGGGGINEILQGARFPWNFFGVRDPVLSGRLDPDDQYRRGDKSPGGHDIKDGPTEASGRHL